ncbi:MAG: PEP-CTERM sorting domain-containing protein [Gemmatimonadaceae bacterium]|nr:PEP-CTERM sorting domain-containing protein [Gemmatimonadaceae bacterium]
MRSVLAGALLLAATATQADAQVSFSSVTGAPDPGYGSQQLIVNFNNLNPASYSGITFSGSYSILAGSVSGAAAPAGVSSGFFAVPDVNSHSSGTAVINFSGFLATRSLTALSFYWGSIDTYNKLEFLDANGNAMAITGASNGTFLTGTDIIAGANGDQTIPSMNRRVFFDLSQTSGFTSLRVTSDGRAFEIDDIAGNYTTVPEPASLALLSVGVLGLAGVARKRKTRG